MAGEVTKSYNHDVYVSRWEKTIAQCNKIPDKRISLCNNVLFGTYKSCKQSRYIYSYLRQYLLEGCEGWTLCLGHCAINHMKIENCQMNSQSFQMQLFQTWPSSQRLYLEQVVFHAPPLKAQTSSYHTTSVQLRKILSRQKPNMFCCINLLT